MSDKRPGLVEIATQLLAHSVEAFATLRRIAADNESPPAQRARASRAISKFQKLFE
jgi:hypothetical protein